MHGQLELIRFISYFSIGDLNGTAESSFSVADNVNRTPLISSQTSLDHSKCKLFIAHYIFGQQKTSINKQSKRECGIFHHKSLLYSNTSGQRFGLTRVS